MYPVGILLRRYPCSYNSRYPCAFLLVVRAYLEHGKASFFLFICCAHSLSLSLSFSPSDTEQKEVEGLRELRERGEGEREGGEATEGAADVHTRCVLPSTSHTRRGEKGAAFGRMRPPGPQSLSVVSSFSGAQGLSRQREGGGEGLIPSLSSSSIHIAQGRGVIMQCLSPSSHHASVSVSLSISLSLSLPERMRCDL